MNNPPTGTQKQSKNGAASASASSSRGDTSSRSSKKARSVNSNAPAACATNENGRLWFSRRQRSVLSHPLGLPLFRMFNDPSTAATTVSVLGDELINKLLGKSSAGTPVSEDGARLDFILERAISAWLAPSPAKEATRNEPGLTKEMSKLIEHEYSTTDFHSDAEVGVAVEYEDSSPHKLPAIDILLSTEKKSCMERSTPLVVIEVGRSNSDWWQKFDQGCKYVVSLGETQEGDNRLDFTEPLLYAVLTIEGEKGGDIMFEARQAVFLCSRKGNHDMRMTLLRQSKTDSIRAASLEFGRLLRVTSFFKDLRKACAEKTEETVYQYFSSSCCKVGDHVLRSYDSRFRPTDRSPLIYLQNDPNVVGGEVEQIVKFPTTLDVATFKHNDSNGTLFWSSGMEAGRGLLIIATPYRKGTHVATSPASFLPIIEHLQYLHKMGLVHGDIRAYNTVFGEQNPNKKEKEGCLIDFDYGGRIGQTKYPQGYQARLADGLRRGVGNGQIEKWHDWYAMGQLMFHVHIFDFANVAPEHLKKFSDIRDFWRDEIQKEPSEQYKVELKTALVEMDQQGVPVKPRAEFADVELLNAGALERTTPGTYIGATGSPPEKNAL